VTIPILSLAVGAFLIWAAITGQNPLAVVKSVLVPTHDAQGATRNIKPVQGG
jgi:hypothetical protein